MKNVEMAIGLKIVIGSLVEKIDAGKYRAFSLQLDLVIREFSDEFATVGINCLSVLQDLYYMDGHDEQIKDLLVKMDGVLDMYIAYQNSCLSLISVTAGIVHSDDYVNQYELARSICPIDQEDPDDELY